MITNSWVMAVGVRLHGLALARPPAMGASPTAATKAIAVNAIPLLSFRDRPSAVATAA